MESLKVNKTETLDDLRSVIGDGFSVNDVSYPIPMGIIPIRKSFRGSIGFAKIDGKGKPITMTPRGYCFDEVKSALQKSIRGSQQDFLAMLANVRVR